MVKSIGQKIALKRKESGLTQEELAEKIGVSSQAVSKWENDLSYPDITSLPLISKILGISIDELLSNEKTADIQLIPSEKRKNLEDMLLRIIVNSEEGDKVKINLPMTLIKAAVELGLALPQVSGNNSLKNINFDEIMKIVESGVVGKILEVESSEGDTVEIIVE